MFESARPRRRMPVTRCLSVALLLAACQSVETPDKKATWSAPATVIAQDPIDRASPLGRVPISSAEQQFALQPLFESARKLVEQRLGVSLSTVTLEITSDDVIAQEVRAETARLVEAQFKDGRFAKHFLDTVMHGQAGTFVALYSHRRQAVLASYELLNHYVESVDRDQVLADNAVMALLIHELVHAADSQRFDISGRRQLNFRASFAESAVFEGHAQWVTREICEVAYCSDGVKALDRFMFGEKTAPNQITQSVEAISRNILEYSYVEGENFIAALALRDDSGELLNQALANPPSDPVAILNPDAFPDAVRRTRNGQLLEALNSVDHDWMSDPWAMVQTSPLKGVNLRSDPARRAAAIQGFTQLISAMISMQLYDQRREDDLPMEITLLQAIDNQTASLFADTLHDVKYARPEDRQFMRAIPLENPTSDQTNGATYTALSTVTPEGDHTLVALRGRHVIQVSGSSRYANDMQRFVTRLFLKLDAMSPADDV